MKLINKENNVYLFNDELHVRLNFEFNYIHVKYPIGEDLAFIAYLPETKEFKIDFCKKIKKKTVREIIKEIKKLNIFAGEENENNR